MFPKMKKEEFEKLMHDIVENPRMLESLPDNMIFLDPSSTIWTRCFTPKRMELLKIIHKKNPRSVTELAKLTNREVENVYRDLKELQKYELVELKKHGNHSEPKVTKAAIVISLA